MNKPQSPQPEREQKPVDWGNIQQNLDNINPNKRVTENSGEQLPKGNSPRPPERNLPGYY